jgi:ankyrin repeat protein
VKILVSRGAQVNHGYEGGFTPLMHTAYAGNVELVSFLLQNGADPNARNHEGRLRLHLLGRRTTVRSLNC